MGRWAWFGGVGRGLEAGERGRRINGGAWLTACLGLGWWAGWVPPLRAEPDPGLTASPPGLAGVSSGQENGKVWSVASTVRFRVDRKDDGGIVICEAQNQALPSGHSKQTQYVLDVQCKCLAGRDRRQGWGAPEGPNASRLPPGGFPAPRDDPNQHSRISLPPTDSPTARIHASQAVVREGDTLVLTCAVSGNPR